MGRAIRQVESDRRPSLQRRRVSVLELCSRHLDLVQPNRSKALFDGRKSILSAWCNHSIALPALAGRGKLIGGIRADLILNLVTQLGGKRCPAVQQPGEWIVPRLVGLLDRLTGRQEHECGGGDQQRDQY